MSVPAVMSMTPHSAIRKTALHPARHGKMSPKIGFVPPAVSEKMLFTPLNN